MKHLQELLAIAEASPGKDGIMPLSYKTGKGHKIEAYGIKGMQSKQWRKSFKDRAAMEKWCDDNDATVHGTAEIKEGLNEGKFIDLTPDQERAIANEISDHLHTDVEVTSVTKNGDVFTAHYMFDDGKERTGAIKFTGKIRDHRVDNIVFKSVVKEGKDDDLGELIDNWIDKEKVFRTEGPVGYRSLTKLINRLGYREMSAFLEDNSGAIEAIIDWVKNQNVPEWKEGFEGYGDNDSDEDDK